VFCLVRCATAVFTCTAVSIGVPNKRASPPTNSDPTPAKRARRVKSVSVSDVRSVTRTQAAVSHLNATEFRALQSDPSLFSDNLCAHEAQSDRASPEGEDSVTGSTDSESSDFVWQCAFTHITKTLQTATLEAAQVEACQFLKQQYLDHESFLHLLISLTKYYT